MLTVLVMMRMYADHEFMMVVMVLMLAPLTAPSTVATVHWSIS